MYDSIFGVSAPKYVYDPSGTPVTVLLDHLTVEEEWADDQDLEQTSVINGFRSWIQKGDYSSFNFVINLFKYDDPRAKYEEIKVHNRKLVTLYPHRDNSSLSIICRLHIKPFRLDASQWGMFDKLLLSFKSQGYVDLSNGATPIIDSGDIIMTGGGII